MGAVYSTPQGIPPREIFGVEAGCLLGRHTLTQLEVERVPPAQGSGLFPRDPTPAGVSMHLL